MPFLKTDTIKLYYEEHGQGEPLVLIAGLASHSKSWMNFLRPAAEKYRTIVFDNRGVGQSEVPNPPYSIEDMANDSLRLMDHLGIEKAHILGHSMGAFIGMNLAARKPERVQKLILECNSLKLSDRNTWLFENLYHLLDNGLGMREFTEQLLFWLLKPERFENSGFMDALIEYAIQDPFPQTKQGFRGQIDALINYQMDNRIQNITCETLIVRGSHDILNTREESIKLYDSLKCKKHMCVVENSGHSIHVENPAASTKAVLDFLKQQ